MKNELKTKHLEFIEAIITRQGNNSFLLRGWVVTIIVALLAFPFGKQILLLEVSLCSLILTFFIFDIYYLRQERLFRTLYDHVRKLKEKEIDFDMKTKRFYKNKDCSWRGAFWSYTSLFYIFLTIATSAFVYLKYLS